ncbi:uncharacterized protein N0V89_006520 [Didymosphaeria variabile]|uniref:Uncharacterized protein n=1 Tax=Didymosphaeria variabile TaxID=1932322 RepID=A0A9W8XIB8_9PLEO|nr:uncharacterized protein N0V89_006520 [Didymosphaeria variabile]KAJ4351181.1 hypothetical protein N0V89_006520 [Didymosphaeria variabile]
MVSFTALLALSASALATPVLQTRQMDIPANWTWHVSGWSAGCARSGCYYDFNVTVPTVEGQIAGVKAYCSGSENWYRLGNYYRNCQILEGVNNGVSAKFSERTSDDGTPPQEIELSFELAGYEQRPAYNFTGSHETIYNQFVAPAQEFDVTPTEVTGVA